MTNSTCHEPPTSQTRSTLVPSSYAHHSNEQSAIPNCQPNREPSFTAGNCKWTQFSKQLILPKTLMSENPCRLTVSVTRWWAGRDNVTLPEPTSSHVKCLKTRRLPPVGCTLCWALLAMGRFKLMA